MKILHVVASLDKMQGGPPPVITGMCAALAMRGHQVALYANQSAQPFLSPAAAPFELRYFPLDWGPYQVSLEMARQLRDLQGADIVHIHMLYRFPQAMAAYQARRQGVAYCMQPHGALAPAVYNGKRRLARRAYVAAIERRNLSSAAGVIFTAEQELAWARELDIAPPRPFIIPVGADIKQLSRIADGSAFRERHGIGGRRVVLWMGRLVESKGLELLIGAFAQAARDLPDLALLLAGPDTGNYRTVLEKLAADLGRKGQVIFTGMLEGEEKQQAFCAADWFALPSQSENFGLVALEAMAVGCPVLLSPGVSIAPDVAAAGAGFIVQREKQDWAAAIRRHMSNDSERMSSAESARNFAWRYDWSKVASQLEDAYRDMLVVG